jgi:hypothetical protein
MTDKEKAKWFDAALRFALNGKIQLVQKSFQNGVGKWAIVDTSNNMVLNSNLEWEPELPLAKRDESYLIRTRFGFEDAVSMYTQYKMFASESNAA